tara:strand:- start:186 stop:845 length:660 start_codon:yes stop_codon:yes gene_type:complete
MPRPAINDYTFYKIVNINGDVDLCYVGSTCNMKQRRKSHKSDCNNENCKNYNLKLYKTIREYGGWDEFKMIEIGNETQLTKRQAEQIEETYRVQLKANLNTLKCFKTEQEIKEYNKQYRIDNADKINEKAKQYYIDNPDKIKQYRIDNADKMKEYRKQYSIDNVDKLKEYRKQYSIDNPDKKKEKHTCNCGGKYTLVNKSQHLKTKMHQEYIQSLSPNI